MLDDIVSKASRDLVARQEAYLLEFFGSVENAERFGHLYVFETSSPELVEGSAPDTYTLRQEIRLRPKTPEERAAEHARESRQTDG